MIYKDIEIRTVVAGTAEFPRHSEASILELKDGGLLMAWQCHGSSDKGARDEAPSTISLMNSRDGGRTWTDRRVAAEMIPGCVNCYSPDLFRCRDGALSLFFKRYTHLKPHEPILNSEYRIDSFDEGKTWSRERTLWENSNEASTLNHAIRRLSDGSALMPVTRSEGAWGAREERIYVSVLRSEDDFSSWTRSPEITVPMRGLMEPCIAERADGTLDMVMRTQLGSVFHSESKDGGRTWSKPQTTGLAAPESCPCIVSVPHTNAQLVIWNNSEYDMNWYSHYGRRSPLTMAITRDGLKTFTDFYDLESDPKRAFTNPAVTVTRDGLFVLNYWTTPYFPNGRMINGYIDLKIAAFRIDI